MTAAARSRPAPTHCATRWETRCGRAASSCSIEIRAPFRALERGARCLKATRSSAPWFNAPVVELLTARQTARHADLVALGPDAITSEFDAHEARMRMRCVPDLPIGVALVSQRLMAGVGNVFKSEVLFARRVSPFARVVALPDDVLDGLIAEAHRLLRLNANGWRRTMPALSERDRVWVYGRSGRPCRVCGACILTDRQGTDGRITYYCPRC